MKRFSPRTVLAAGCVAAALAGAVVAAERSASAMATAATAFLDSLTPEQRQRAALSMNSDDRFRWNYIPTETFARKGLTINEMTEAQRARAQDLLKAGLSQRGYLTATSIMSLESVLGEVERRSRDAGQPAASFQRGPGRYFFSVFGTPTAKQPWGWRVEGHHLSLHFTVVNGALVASSPTFFGTNPAEVRDGPKKGLRILGDQEDAARALLTALDNAQRAKAIIQGVALNEIVTENKVEVNPLSPVGLMADVMTPAQRDLLTTLIDVYASRMPSDLAAERMDKVRKAGIEKVAFAWAGETEPGKKHYYRVQGPTFLIELDNSQNDGNHIHSVWRDFSGDFGRDLLREHLKASAH
jgi:hypothetical protein